MEYFDIIFQEVYKILFLLVPVLVSVAMIVWLDRRVWAFVQKRQGPNVVGPVRLTSILELLQSSIVFEALATTLEK